jgi:hypothetical protein
MNDVQKTTPSGIAASKKTASIDAEMQKYVDKIKYASSLWALLNAVNEAESYMKGKDIGVLDNYLENSQLQTFGGEAPRDISEIWSWDAEDLMVVGPDGNFVLVARDESTT